MPFTGSRGVFRGRNVAWDFCPEARELGLPQKGLHFRREDERSGDPCTSTGF